MRLFVAIELDKNVKAAVKSVADGLSMFGKGSFCPKDSYHITLAFLGELETAAAAVAAMDAVELSALEAELADMGSFGSTYYVAVKKSPGLCRLQAALVKELKNRGIRTEEREFTPHITLARRFTGDMPPMVFVPECTFNVKGISLMETVGQGIYKTLYFKETVE